MEPVEDFRIDFEDGYGNRPDAEEDGHAQSAAREVAPGSRRARCRRSSASASSRCRTSSHARSLRTLDLFVTSWLGATGGRLPPNFVVTLPKIMAPARSTAVADTLRGARAPARSCRPASLQLEIMVETPQSILDADGHVDAAARSSPPASGRVTRRALRDLRLHGELQHHRGAPAHAPPGVRLRQAHDAGRVRADRRVALRRRDEHHAGRAASRRAGATAHRQQSSAKPRRRAPRVEAALRRRPPLARQRLLPGLGPASGAAADALRRGLRLLPRRAPAAPRACATSSTRPRRRRSSATSSTTRRRARGC